MAVTIKDIARKAGVSHTTVSRALRGSSLISVEVSRHIHKIADEMGYHASAAARSLKTNRTQALGVIVSHIADPFFGEILQGIDDVAQQNGYSTFIASAQHNPAREQAILRSMQEHRVDGVIICSTSFGAEQARQILSYHTPVVTVNNQSNDQYACSIFHNDLDGSRQVVRHLIQLGHKKIAYLGNKDAGRTNAERLLGYRQELLAAGIPIASDYLYEAAGSSPEQAEWGLRYFLALPDRPTAYFCYNDMLAFGVLQGLARAGINTPQDCSVAGFDNIAFSLYTNPPLTTLDQPKYHMGVESARLLLEVLHSSPVEAESPVVKIRSLKGKLIVRGSTAPPHSVS